MHIYFIIIVFLFLAGLLEEMLLHKLIGMDRMGLTAFLSAGTAALYLGICGVNTGSLFRLIMLEILLYASAYDLAAHMIPDYVPVMILMTGLYHMQWLPALLGLVLVPLPFLAAALFKEGSIGGGDIKLMGAIGFVLGVSKGYMTLVASLCIAVIYEYAGNRKKGEAFPLAPYLTVGCLLIALQK